MKPLRHCKQVVGFTLIEMLVVIAIIGILAAMLLPALNQGKQRAYRAACLSNLKQIGVAFQSFANEHQGKFPMQVSTNDAGLMEMIPYWECCTNVFYPLASLSNELSNPKLLTCPADLGRLNSTCGPPPTNFTDVLLRTKSSYVAWFRSENDGLPTTIIASDGNIGDDHYTYHPVCGKGARALSSDTNNLIKWTEDLHRFVGNMAFADGHVEALKNGPELVTTVSRSTHASAQRQPRRVSLATPPPSRPGVTSAARPGSSRSVQSNSASEKTSPKATPGSAPGPAGYVPLYAQASSPSPSTAKPTLANAYTNRAVLLITNEVSAKPVEADPVSADDSTMGTTDVVVVHVIQSTFKWIYLLVLLAVLAYLAYKYHRWQRRRQLARQPAEP